MFRGFGRRNQPRGVSEFKQQIPYPLFGDKKKDEQKGTETPLTYDADIFLEFNERWRCSICLDTCRNPVTLESSLFAFAGRKDSKSCDHVFCKTCINDWAAQQKTCPSCRTPFQRTSLSQTIQSEIGSSQVICQNSAKSCDWIGEFGINGTNLLEHLQQECVYEPITCPSCSRANVLRSELDYHQQYICSHRMIQCPLSPQCPTLRADQLANHLLDDQSIKNHLAESKRIATLKAMINQLGSRVKELELSQQQLQAQLAAEQEQRQANISTADKLPSAVTFELDDIDELIRTKGKRVVISPHLLSGEFRPCIKLRLKEYKSEKTMVAIRFAFLTERVPVDQSPDDMVPFSGSGSIILGNVDGNDPDRLVIQQFGGPEMDAFFSRHRPTQVPSSCFSDQKQLMQSTKELKFWGTSNFCTVDQLTNCLHVGSNQDEGVIQGQRTSLFLTFRLDMN